MLDFDSSGVKMRLERVDITGFKSFGDKAEITFHRGVTAVVGPNGCGKSNVADAIGWVLGEQSAKSLRGKRMEDLIFNGTESRQPQSLAEVNLHVSNVVLPRAKSKKSTDALRGEVLVTRRLNRSGDSEYLLDGVPSRLRDVHDLFMGTGVGAKAYAIIEQGKIGLILSTKPTDRRFIIEEAAGITKYKSRRRSAELKLTAAQQNLMRIKDIVYEINRQMNSLKRQAGKARRYHRFRDAMSHLEKVYFVKSAKQKDSQLGAVRVSLNSVLDEESRRITSLTVADSYLARTRIREAELASKLADARESLHQLEMAVERGDQSVKRDKQQRVELASRRSQLKADKSAIEARRVPITDRLNDRIREELDLGQQLVVLDQASEEQQEKLKEASVDLGVLESSIEKRRSDIVYRISKVAALHNFLQGVASNEDAASEELVKLTAEKRDLETEFLRVKDLLSESTSEIDLERQNTQLLATERSDVHLQVDDLRQQVQVFDVEIASVKEEVSSLTARLDSLEELVASRMHFGNGARILFEQGEVQGVNIRGSLVDAIEVEERFELAVEAFLGEMLQAVCVIDERDVVRANLLLKKEKQGCRTSLFVESLLPEISTQQLTKVVAALRNKGILGIEGVLSEYIKFVSMPAPSLPDSIVVENLDTALQCYRFEQVEYVTLNGEVVKPSGFVDMGLGGTSAGMLQSKREIRTLRISLESKVEKLRLSSVERSKRCEKLDKALGLTEKIRDQQHLLEKKLVGLSHRHEQLQEEIIRINRKQDVLVL